MRPACVRRPFSLNALLVPPAVFTGLFLSLWLYKCCMMVAFQNKIIYMPGLPPMARRETIADYARACYPVVWREERINTIDGKDIALCVGRAEGNRSVTRGAQKPVVVLYFQGCAS